MSDPTALLPFQPATMSTAQQAAVSNLARYAGRTHALYACQLKQWSGWCQTDGLDRWSRPNDPISSCTSVSSASGR